MTRKNIILSVEEFYILTCKTIVSCMSGNIMVMTVKFGSIKVFGLDKSY